MQLLHKTAQIISQPLTLHSTTRKRMQHNPHQKLSKPRTWILALMLQRAQQRHGDSL